MRRGRRSRACRLRLFEPFADPPRKRVVPLALVPLKREREGRGRLVRPAGTREHLGEVAERIALEAETVGALGERDRLPRESLGLVVPPALRLDERLHPPPECLPYHVVRVGERPSLPCQV